jgi:hypothetical protein
VSRERIVAIALLTEANMRAIGRNLERAYPVDHSPDFSELLVRIEKTEKTRQRG